MMTRNLAGLFAGIMTAAALCTTSCSTSQDNADAPRGKSAAAVKPARAFRKPATVIAPARPADLEAAIQNVATLFSVRSPFDSTSPKTQEVIKQTVESKDFPKDEFAYFCRNKDYTDWMALNFERDELRKTIPEEWTNLLIFELFFELEERLGSDCTSQPNKPRNLSGVPEDYEFSPAPDKAVAARNIVTHLCRHGDEGHAFIRPINGKASFDRMVEVVSQSRVLKGKKGSAIVAAFSSKRYFDYLEQKASLNARRQSLQLGQEKPSKEFHKAMQLLMTIAWAGTQGTNDLLK